MSFPGGKYVGGVNGAQLGTEQVENGNEKSTLYASAIKSFSFVIYILNQV